MMTTHLGGGGNGSMTCCPEPNSGQPCCVCVCVGGSRRIWREEEPPLGKLTKLVYSMSKILLTTGLQADNQVDLFNNRGTVQNEGKQQNTAQTLPSRD